METAADSVVEAVVAADVDALRAAAASKAISSSLNEGDIGATR